MTALTLRFPGPENDDVRTVATIVRLRLAEFELRRQAGTIKKRTFEKEVLYLNSFMADFGHVIIENARNSNITEWLSSHQEWVSPHTKSDAVSSVVRCFKLAAEEREIDYNPYHRPRKLIPPLRPRKPIEEWEYKAVMAAARSANGLKGKPSRHVPATDLPLFDLFDRVDKRPALRRRKTGEGKGRKKGVKVSAGAFRRACWFLWQTGCRTCEMAELLWDMIDWQKGIARLEHHKTAEATDHDRLIALPRRVIRLLRLMWRHRNREVDHVFTSSWGKKPWQVNDFAKRFKEYADLAGLKTGISPYSLRHGFTVTAIESGLGNKQIADLLGHTSTRYVDWYGRSSKTKTDYLRESADQVRRRKRKPK